MINILDKVNCCGCAACVQKCPKQSISLHEDNEGFLYPVVNEETCIDCGLCDKVCPVLSQDKPKKPLKVYAAINKNEVIRSQSSSGGIFTLLAEEIIKAQGVVFGARFDENWEVRHDFTETIEGIAAFRGSKYVQSQIGNNFQKVESFLKKGRKVLFCGTPCQIAGLKRFLRKEYDNLFTVDFICHGVPSPGVWRKYLKEKIKEEFGSHCEEGKVINISFRDKSISWEKYSFVLDFVHNGTKIRVQEEKFKNLYLRGFLADLYLRPSCHQCPTKELKSGSDITIADFWKIENVLPAFYSSKGVSCLIVNSNNGNNLLMNVKSLMDYKETEFDLVVNYNKALLHSSILKDKRYDFFKLIKSIEVCSLIDRLTHRTLFDKIVSKLKKLFGKR